MPLDERGELGSKSDSLVSCAACLVPVEAAIAVEVAEVGAGVFFPPAVFFGLVRLEATRQISASDSKSVKFFLEKVSFCSSS